MVTFGKSWLHRRAVPATGRAVTPAIRSGRRRSVRGLRNVPKVLADTDGVCRLRAVTRWPPQPDDPQKSRDIQLLPGLTEGRQPDLVGGPPKFRATVALPGGWKLISSVCRRVPPRAQEEVGCTPRWPPEPCLSSSPLACQCRRGYAGGRYGRSSRPRQSATGPPVPTLSRRSSSFFSRMSSPACSGRQPPTFGAATSDRCGRRTGSRLRPG